MGHIVKELLLDCSTPEYFQFSLRCAECGRVWRNKAARFSRAGTRPETEGKRVVYDTLYRREKEAALDRAVGEAEGAFSQCPICRRLVCDHCFLICDDLDMCASCAQRLQERGEPVTQPEPRSGGDGKKHRPSGPGIPPAPPERKREKDPKNEK